MRTINIHEAKTHLSRLVEDVAAGEEIIIAKNGRPCARIVPLETTKLPRQPGGWEGKVSMADDFNDPLPREIEDAFYDGHLDPRSSS